MNTNIVWTRTKLKLKTILYMIYDYTDNKHTLKVVALKVNIIESADTDVDQCICTKLS